MLEIACQCGHPIRGEDHEAVLAGAREHVKAAHAELGLTDQHTSDYVAAALRSGPAKPRRATVGAVEIRPVTPDRVEDVLRFFDTDAFADNPAWASCYCMFYYHNRAEGEWSARSAQENRDAIQNLLGCGRAQGYLAYVDGEPAGWCNAAPRRLLPRMDANEEYRVEDADRVGSIACFVIAPQYRRHGLAGRLLDAACEGFRAQGLAVAEAYPSKNPEGDAEAYHGPLPLYERAGFTLFRELENTTIVRLTLAAEAG